jgi:pimeloyl-ACP methyl ester carboxylesterase
MVPRVGERVDQTLAVLNGLIGDHLERTGNGLATRMALLGPSLQDVFADGTAANPEATPRAVLFVHGIMCNEASWRFEDGSDYGQRLQADLGLTPFYLRYNSGLAIADNGEALASLLQAFVEQYPVPLQELVLIGYSMGGLVVRSACHFADVKALSFLSRVQRAIYIGTPHLGAPAERVGRIVAKVLRTVPDPVTQLIGQIGDLRSAGIKDLGDADLRHADRASVTGRLSLRDGRHPVPLLPSIRHALIAGSLSMDPRIAALFGDSLVPVKSATARTMLRDDLDLPPERIEVLPGRNHLDLMHDEAAYARIRDWCG